MTGQDTLTIREARHEDLEGITMLDALRSSEPKPAYWDRILHAYQRQVEGMALVAVDGKEVRGYLFGEVRAWEFGSERCGWIFAVTVHPELERSGVATSLCRDSMTRFGELGVDLVRTMVRRSDIPVLRFFRRMGFAAGPFNELERSIAPTPKQGGDDD